MDTLPRRHRAWLHLFIVPLIGPGLTWAAVSVRLEVALPEHPQATSLTWGITHGGLEIGQGEQPLSEATTHSVSFTLPLTPDALPAGEVLAHVCLNRDRWSSYIPGFGEQAAVMPLQSREGQWWATIPQDTWTTRTASAAANVLTVHYHRFAEDYLNTSLWTWDEHLSRAPEPNEVYPVGRDDFGAVFQLDTALYGKKGDRIGLLPRRNADWQFKDGPDRFWSPTLGQEVYLVQSTPEVFAHAPDIRPKLTAATLDDERLITVRFTHPLPTNDWPAERFRMMDEAGATVVVAGVEPREVEDGKSSTYALTTASPLDFIAHRYQLAVKDMSVIAVRPAGVLHRSSRCIDLDATLGATYAREQTIFRVFAPTAAAAWVVVADTLHGDAGRAEHVMKRNDHGTWEAVVSGDLAGKYYAYRLDGSGLDSAAEIADIYATCTQNDAARSLIVDLRATDPPGFRESSTAPSQHPASPTDACIYEMHIRDFSIAPTSGIRARGRYLGVTEAGTHLPDDASIMTGLSHLGELGITHVQIMPIQDFDNDETRPDAYNWGYMPVCFNSPDGVYASSVDGPARIREFKQLVQALHARGIGVVMDVVYNHTADNASFEKLVPGYYFRMTDAGEFSNGSGCGNEFMSESPMGRKFILDSLKYWATEYQVDGFRFDLMGLIDLETMKQIKAELQRIRPGILVYGEPWTGGSTPLNPITGHPQVRGTGLGAFNDHFRDAIKGDRDGGPPGFIQVGNRVEGVRHGLLGGITDWSRDPAESINYFEAHDNLTAWDKLRQSVPHATDQGREAMLRFAHLILLTAQGTPFLHAGQEFGRTKQGVGNSYNQPDAINQIDWSLKRTHAGLYVYVRGLIALRQAHPVLRLRTRAEVESRITFGAAPNERSIVYMLDGEGLPGESAGRLLVLLNGDEHEAEFTLPPGQWSIHATAMAAGVEPLGQARGTVKLPAHSGMILSR